jgi:hypothetical protein
VLVGTFKAEPVLCGEEFRRARRAAGQGDRIWERMKEDEVWRKFAQRLWKYQFVRNPVPWTKENEPTELIHVLYEESQGITDVAVKVFLLAQVYAMELYGDKQPEGQKLPSETLTADLFRKASHESLRLLQPFLKALRNNEWDKIKKIDDIQPVLLADAVQEIEAKFQKTALEKEDDDETVVRLADNTTQQHEPAKVNEQGQDAEVKPKSDKPKHKRGTSSNSAVEPLDQKDLVGVIERGTENKKAPYLSLAASGAVVSTDSFIED